MINKAGIIQLPVSRLHMELTNACNFSCEFCPDSKMKRKRGFMSVETAKAILTEAAETGIAETILFHVMGEPTLHPHLVDVVAFAARKGLDTCLTTTGSRLDRELLEGLDSAGLSRIIISLQTPDEKTFSLRGAKGLTYDEYAQKIVMAAKEFLSGRGRTKCTISFLSSPLRRLIIPIFPEVSIADTTAELKRHIKTWTEKIISDSPAMDRYADILRQIKKIRTFRENTIILGSRLSFHTRIMGDWAVHFDRRNVNACFGFCPAVQDNFGVLWNGDYTFCCADYDGMTTTANFNKMSLADYLNSETVQNVVKGFNRFRVVHPHCRQCLGDRNILNALVKQTGSILYFKFIKKHS